MIAVEGALIHILAFKKDFGSTEIPILDAAGRILAEDITATRDFPPFNRVTMDGIAINTQSFHAGNRQFKIEKIQAAGQPPQALENINCAIEVMTGAVLPDNTDAVIPYEDCKLENGIAGVASDQVLPYQNIHRQSTDHKAGEILLKKGRKIKPAAIGILASEGLSRIPVVRLPNVAVCSSGDELVDLTDRPEAWQIRRSNSYVLAAELKKEDIEAELLHLPDDPEKMADQLSSVIENFDVVLFSGAVSKGKFDYLPGVLQHLGMEPVFHGVAQKPGKPFLFGSFKNDTLAFCFPGNPVSTYVCYQYYFKNWLYQSMGIKRPSCLARLSEEIIFKPQLSYHVLVTLSYGDGTILATPVDSSGSGDLVNLAEAEGILTLPANQEIFNKNELFDLIIL